MKKVAMLLLKSTLALLGALGVAGHTARGAHADDSSETAGGGRGPLPDHFSTPGKPELYGNARILLTEAKQQGGTVTGDLPWDTKQNFRVEKKSTKKFQHPTPVARIKTKIKTSSSEAGISAPASESFN